MAVLRPVIVTVDDDLEVLSAVERDLKNRYGRQFRIQKANSGEEAYRLVKFLRGERIPIALIISDQRMPKMQGTEFLEKAKVLCKNTKMLLLTAYSDVDVAIEAINQLGLDHYLLKPWSPPEDKLYPVIDQHLLDWQVDRFHKLIHKAERIGIPEIEIDFGTEESHVLQLPRLGEGDNGVVFDIVNLEKIDDHRILKLTKVRKGARESILEEVPVTQFFVEHDTAVPLIRFTDEQGRYSIKDKVMGESLTKIYLRYDQLAESLQPLIKNGLRDFIDHLLRVFAIKPEYKCSVSPNNIYISWESDEGPVRFILVDPGPSPTKDYSKFDFDDYWDRDIPNRIDKYRRLSYISI